jgi:hypothetical protein
MEIEGSRSMQLVEGLLLPRRDRGFGSMDNGGDVRGEEERVSEREVVSVEKKIGWICW